MPLARANLHSSSYGIVLSTGDLWKEQRRFSLQVLRSFGLGRNVMEDKIMTEARRLSSYLQEECKGNDGQVVLDLSMPLQLCVGNIIASIVFGHTFERGDPKFALLKKIIEENFHLLNTALIVVLNSYPWLRYIPLFGHFGVDDLRQRGDIFSGFLKAELDAHKDELKNRLDDDDEPTDFVEAYLKGKGNDV